MKTKIKGVKWLGQFLGRGIRNGKTMSYMLKKWTFLFIASVKGIFHPFIQIGLFSSKTPDFQWIDSQGKNENPCGTAQWNSGTNNATIWRTE
jgi:hypothetical protein